MVASTRHVDEHHGSYASVIAYDSTESISVLSAPHVTILVATLFPETA